jgi:hypothetical protein
MRAIPRRDCLTLETAHKQSGQALVYGLFMLMAGLAALFFLFNVGQLTREKTKLVNTSDAVAYSAGVMHARSMNFAAYTNRALVADEIAIAQSVSLASWGKYLEMHGMSAVSLGCTPENSYISEPAAEAMFRYALICSALGTAQQFNALNYLNQAIQVAGGMVVVAAEVSKKILQGSQVAMMASLKSARQDVMQEVANANYLNDGEVRVQELPIPLSDTFQTFSDGMPIISFRSGDERTRMRDLEVAIVNKDGFTPTRVWSDRAQIPSCIMFGFYHNETDRSGGTQLVGFDEWQANDRASYYRWNLHTSKYALPSCKKSESTLGRGNQRASAGGSKDFSSDNWAYSGVPSFADLSEAALANSDPRAQFSIRVLRKNTETRTSDARSETASTQRLNAYANGVKQDALSGDKVYVGLAASETFYQRPTERNDGRKELASLFNPYWQTHLMEVPASIRTAAQALQGAVMP